MLVGGDIDAARPMFEESLGSARKRGDLLLTCVALFNLAQATLAQRDRDAAVAALHETIELSLETRDHANLAYALDLLAVAESEQPEWRRVATLMGAAEAMRGVSTGPVYNYYLADSHRLERAQQQAETNLGTPEFNRAKDYGTAMTLDAAVAYALSP